MDKRTTDDAGHDQKVGAKEGVLPKHAQSEADNKRAKQWVWLLLNVNFMVSHLHNIAIIVTISLW